MSKKNYTYIFILVLLVAVSVYLLSRNTGSSIESLKKDFAVEDTSAVTKIFIAERNGHTVTVERQKDNTWLVNGKYKARKELVFIVLSTLKQMRIKSPVNKPMRDKIMKHLATGSTKVEVYEGDKKIKTLYVGSATADGLGTFALIENSNEPFIIHIPGFEGYLTSRFTSDDMVWKDRGVFRMDPSRADLIKVEYPNDRQSSFELKIENANYAKLTNGEGVAATKIDGEFLRQYLERFEDVNYESMIQLRPGQKDSLLSPANLWCTITTFDKEGNKSSAQVYRRYYNGSDFIPSGDEFELDRERVFVLTGKNEVVNGQKWIFNKLAVKYSDFSNPPQKIID